MVLLTIDVTLVYTNISNQESKTPVYRTLLEQNYEEQLTSDSLMKLLACFLSANANIDNSEILDT